ncbi:F-box/kelch-repeat protein [Camellia lanceoleosa]|uniref:F-box/kelch-repeat protein n=1 Tax=Camellia lanceoleosa TaxID=1840588 RepID=A0ACC0GYY9_9ERIC|nr:F-box/kelch-repeat protein [Camellia lanceoleosa]
MFVHLLLGGRRSRRLRRHHRSSPSPSPSSYFQEELYERSLWFCANTHKHNMKWYAVDISNQDSSGVDDECKKWNNCVKRGEKNKLKLIPISRKKYFFSTLVCLDSTIYCLGGFCRGRTMYENHPTNDVRRFKSASPSPRWKNLISGLMNVGRYSPAAVVLGGKLYVMGGNHVKIVPKGTENDTWAEVFDPKTKKWSFLPKPTCCDKPLPSARFLCMALEGLQKILVAVDYLNEAYLYHVSQNKWTKHPLTKHLRVASLVDKTNMAVLGSTLYWYDKYNNDTGMYAYDLETGKSFSGKIRGFKNAARKIRVDPCEMRTFLFHLTGKCFCLVWEQGPTVHCTKFVVEKSSYLPIKRKASLCAWVLSSQAYDLGPNTKFFDVVLMNKRCELPSSSVVVELKEPTESTLKLDLMHDLVNYGYVEILSNERQAEEVSFWHIMQEDYTGIC